MERRLEILPTYYPCHDFVSVIIIDLHVFFFYKIHQKLLKLIQLAFAIPEDYLLVMYA